MGYFDMGYGDMGVPGTRPQPQQQGSDTLSQILQYLSSMKRSAPTQRSPYADVSFGGMRDAITPDYHKAGSGRLEDQLSLQGLPQNQQAEPDLEELRKQRILQQARQASMGGGRPRPQPQGYDTAAMDQLTAGLSGGITEGPNANIQDDTRARALAWLAQQQGGM